MSTSTACSSHQFNAKTHESNTWVLSDLSLCPRSSSRRRRRRRRRRSIQPETSSLSLVPVKPNAWPGSESANPVRAIPRPDQTKLFVEAEPDKNVTEFKHSIQAHGHVRTLDDFTLGQLPTPRHCLHDPNVCLSGTNGYFPADMPWICASDPMGRCAMSSPPRTLPSSHGAGNSSSSRFTLDVVDEDRPLVSLAPDISSAMSDTMSDSGQCLDSDMDSDSDSDSDLADLGSSMKNENVVSSAIITDNKFSSENMEVQTSYNRHPNPSNLLELSSSLGTSSSPPPPSKIGLSRFYVGKSRSFSCLGDVVSLADVVKPENPYAKKRKYNNSISSFDRTSQLPPLQKDVATVSKKSLLINSDGNGCQRGIVASRSYSFSDLQGVGTQFSPC